MFIKRKGQKETYLSPARRANRFVPTRPLLSCHRIQTTRSGTTLSVNIDETSSSEINFIFYIFTVLLLANWCRMYECKFKKKKKRKRIQKWKRSEEFYCSSFIEYGKGFFYTFLIKELKKYRREFFSIHCFRYFAVRFFWLINHFFFFLISHKCTKRNSWTGTQEFQEAYIRFVEKNKGRRSIIDRIDAWEKVFVFRGRASGGRVVLEPARKRGV